MEVRLDDRQLKIELGSSLDLGELNQFNNVIQVSQSVLSSQAHLLSCLNFYAKNEYEMISHPHS